MKIGSAAVALAWAQVVEAHGYIKFVGVDNKL
jgi:hypothetical protein